MLTSRKFISRWSIGVQVYAMAEGCRKGTHALSPKARLPAQSSLSLFDCLEYGPNSSLPCVFCISHLCLCPMSLPCVSIPSLCPFALCLSRVSVPYFSPVSLSTPHPSGGSSGMVVRRAVNQTEEAGPQVCSSSTSVSESMKGKV